MTEQRPLAVIDVDGVVADVRHRLHHVERRPRRWSAFFAAAVDDPPLPEGIALVTTLARDHDVVYLTGRPEGTRQQTESWLAAHGLPSGPVHMRPHGDRRPAKLAKPALLRRLARGRRVAVVVDDDPAVCDAIETAGWPVLRADWMLRSRSLDEAQETEGRT